MFSAVVFAVLTQSGVLSVRLETRTNETRRANCTFRVLCVEVSHDGRVFPASDTFELFSLLILDHICLSDDTVGLLCLFLTPSFEFFSAWPNQNDTEISGKHELEHGRPT